jgi:predicted SAM-dependent methyltransferase
MRKLHIGGKVRLDGWEVLNAIPGDYVDHVGDARDLTRFADNTFGEVYASHVVEHFDYMGELERTLREWYRVLIPAGRISISVPDLDILATLFLQKETMSFEDRFMIMRMIFGGHVNEYDHHKVGLSHDLLTGFLMLAGFTNIVRVGGFGIFNDSSNAVFKGQPISLSMVAAKAVVADVGGPR